eukprot:scaffold74543_cov42-Phaeocystis_antarctica.AAC.1
MPRRPSLNLGQSVSSGGELGAPPSPAPSPSPAPAPAPVVSPATAGAARITAFADAARQRLNVAAAGITSGLDGLEASAA